MKHVSIDLYPCCKFSSNSLNLKIAITSAIDLSFRLTIALVKQKYPKKIEKTLK